jgi:hypothetical protein
MAQQTLVRNPFMLMMHPEVVIAAMEKSERLNQLNRHLCRPLDRQGPQGRSDATSEANDAEDDEPGSL